MGSEPTHRSAGRIVSGTSRQLAAVRGEAIGAVVERSLAELGPYVGADGVVLLRTCRDDSIEFLHAWFAGPGPRPLQDGHRSKAYNWLKPRLIVRGAQVIDLTEVRARFGRDAAPPGLHEVGIIGTVAGDAVAGALCFCYRGERRPRVEELEPFEVLGDILLGAVTRRDAELAHLASEERYRSIVETSAEGIWTTDAEWRISFANERMAAMLGYRVDEIVGRPLLDFIPDERKPMVRLRARRREAGITEAVETEYLRRDGSVIQVRLSTAPMIGPDGNFRGALAMATDVTVERRLQHELASARRLESIGQLAGGVAHDINNALTVILLHAARGERIATGSSKQAFEEILNAGHRASEVAYQLLAFARREPAQPITCDLGPIVQSLMPMLERVVGEHVTITRVLASDRWSVLVDPIQLERVLINIAANARDAMPDGGALAIDVRNRVVDDHHGKVPAGDYVAITLRDTGHGMPPDVVARLFEPFFTTKADAGGTGLGLASSYGLMHQLGGTIEVDSTPGVGTTLTLLCQRSMLESSSSDRFPRSTAAPTDRDRTVLLVEDAAVLREAITTVLAEAGYRVIAAADGRQAHQLSDLEPGAIHLLVTDVVLPQMNGYRLAEVLRAARPALSVLYLSGYDRPRGLDEALRAPRTAFASKPFAPETLLATLARLLP